MNEFIITALTSCFQITTCNNNISYIEMYLKNNDNVKKLIKKIVLFLLLFATHHQYSFVFIGRRRDGTNVP